MIAGRGSTREGAVMPRDELAYIEPRFRWGGVTASGGSSRVAIDMSYEFNKIVPDYVMQITGGKGTSRPLEQGKVDEAIANYWDAVEQLARAKVDVIILRGVPVSAQLGRDRVVDLLGETERRYGIRATSSLEDILAAMRHLRGEVRHHRQPLGRSTQREGSAVLPGGRRRGRGHRHSRRRRGT
jgi:hypothetical protein